MTRPPSTTPLDRAFSRGSIEAVTTGWLLPALTALGDAWVNGTLSVAGEHLASHAIFRRLSTAYESVRARPGGPKLVVGLPEGAHHELGALAFATVCRRLGAHDGIPAFPGAEGGHGDAGELGGALDGVHRWWILRPDPQRSEWGGA